MTAFEVVAAVIAAFFGLGIAMGVLIVVALPRRRRRSTYMEKGPRAKSPTPPGDYTERQWWQDR